MYFSSLSSPAPPAGRLLHDGAALGDRARERRVVELEVARSGRERDQLDVVADRLAGARADQAIGADQLDRQEVADLEVDRRRRARLADRADDRVVVARRRRRSTLS